MSSHNVLPNRVKTLPLCGEFSAEYPGAPIIRSVNPSLSTSPFAKALKVKKTVELI
jgi:hypothetical protein